MGYVQFTAVLSKCAFVQGQLFKTYHMSPFQMMFGVNMFSCLFTSVSLLEQGGFFQAFTFMTSHLDFAAHTVVLSVSGCLPSIYLYKLGKSCFITHTLFIGVTV